jgi:hypothetical protein
MMNLVRWLSAGAALVMLAAAPARAQETDPAVEMHARLDVGMSPHAARGYQRARGIDDLIASLRIDGAVLWPVTLRAGVNYRVYGACDTDCSDVDMEIYGVDGQLVEKDINRDDTPFVQVRPTRSGVHYVRVWLFDCVAEPCMVGARVVSGGRPEVRAAAENEATPDNEFTTFVHGALEDFGARARGDGYAPFGEDIIATLGVNAQGHREVVRLEAGRSYLFQGACDQDCLDLNLEVLDPLGESVARDDAPGNRPSVSLEPRHSGDYTIRAWLGGCSAEPCWVGVRAFARAAH